MQILDGKNHNCHQAHINLVYVSFYAAYSEILRPFLRQSRFNAKENMDKCRGSNGNQPIL